MLFIILCALRPVQGPRRPISSAVLPDRAWIGFQFQSPSILGPALTTQLRHVPVLGLARPNDPANNLAVPELHPCLSAFLSANRVPTGARTDSGEERKREVDNAAIRVTLTRKARPSPSPRAASRDTSGT